MRSSHFSRLISRLVLWGMACVCLALVLNLSPSVAYSQSQQQPSRVTLAMPTLKKTPSKNAQQSVPQGQTSGSRNKGFADTAIEVLLAPPSSWPVTVKTDLIYLAPSPKTLRSRIEALQSQPDVAEPVVLKLNAKQAPPLIKQLGHTRILERLASPNLAPRMLREFHQSVFSRVKNSRLELVPDDLDWLDLEKLSMTLRQSSHAPMIANEDWMELNRNPENLEQARAHLSFRASHIWDEVERWLAHNSSAKAIPLTLFVPQHMRKLLGKYSPVRGRNCFGTALSFNDKAIENVPNINLVREPGHHMAMINSDEFSHALWLGYYELEGADILSGLELGDVVVFFDATEGDSYQALRHAAVHLAGEYYLHKQSKSAVSPIEFTTWKDLVATWQPLTRQLDYKVFRKFPYGSLRQQNPQIAIEKIFWSQ